MKVQGSPTQGGSLCNTVAPISRGSCPECAPARDRVRFPNKAFQGPSTNAATGGLAELRRFLLAPGEPGSPIRRMKPNKLAPLACLLLLCGGATWSTLSAGPSPLEGRTYSCRLYAQGPTGEGEGLELAFAKGQFTYTEIDGNTGEKTVSKGRYTLSGEKITLSPPAAKRSALYYKDSRIFPNLPDFNIYKKDPGVLKKLDEALKKHNGEVEVPGLPKDPMLVCESK